MADILRGAEIEQRPSPNCGPRKLGIEKPDMVVLHYTAMGSAEDAICTLCDPEKQVSAHYLIGRDGRAVQMVDETLRAWHAGAGRWAGCDDINSRLKRWDIPAHHVIAHSDMAPLRKIDPGARFDWKRLALGGMSVWPDAGSDQPLTENLEALGYAVTEFGVTACLNAFRLRYAPSRAGVECDACGGLDGCLNVATSR